jgi:alpha-1,2-glucosyltransferase
MKIKAYLEDKSVRLYLAVIVAFFLFLWIVVSSQKPLADERFHYAEIKSLYHNQWEIKSYLTTIPGYHFVIAMLMKSLNSERLFTVRALSLCFSLMTLPMVWLIGKKLLWEEDEMRMRLLQFLLFPLSLPFFFLAYTDMFSLLIILLSFYFLLKKQYSYAGLCIIASCLVRQTNIIWLLFELAYVYLDIVGWKSFSKEVVVDFFKKTRVFMLGLVAFLVFLYLNGGVAVGDRTNQQMGFFLGNIYFVLFLFFALFFPVHIANAKKIWAFVRTRSILSFAIVSLIGVSFVLVSRELHVYNIDPYFLRNDFIKFVYASPLALVAYYIAITISVFSLIVTKLAINNAWIMYPATFVFLVPSHLIEQRYYIVPFVLFMLLREKISKKGEYAIIIFNAVVSVIFLILIFSRKYFI